jgi:methyl-accepting chemotaxis protein
MAFGFARRRSLLVKFYVALLIAVLPLLFLLQWYVLPGIRQQLRDDRVRAVRQLVMTREVAVGANQARVVERSARVVERLTEWSAEVERS